MKNMHAILSQAIKEIESLPQYDGRPMDLIDKMALTSLRRNMWSLERRGRDMARYLEDGTEIDMLGRVIDELGYLLNEDGDAIDEDGNLITIPKMERMSKRIGT